jgi:hypothetical protein
MVAAVLVAPTLVAGCGTGKEVSESKPTKAPRSDPSASSGSRAAVPSGSPSGSVHTFAELVKQPCLAIDDEDAGPTRLSIIVEGTQTHHKGNPTSCQWGARGGLVDFTPYASTDLTMDEEYQHLTRRKIQGHRVLLGTVSRGEKTSHIAYVAVGARQSFRLMVTPFGEGAPGPDALTLATNFTKAILAHLP